MEKPTTDNLKALGYEIVQRACGYAVMRPDGSVVLSSYSWSQTKAWDLAREFVAREIAATTQPKENKPC